MDTLPAQMAIILLDDIAPFPGQVVPVHLDSVYRRDALSDAKNTHGFIFLVHQKKPVESQVQAPHIAILDEQTHRLLRDEDIQVLHPLEHWDRSEKEADPPRGAYNLQELCQVGVVGRLVKVLRLQDGRLTAFVHIMCRAQLVQISHYNDLTYRIAHLIYPSEQITNPKNYHASFRQLKVVLRRLFEFELHLPEDLRAVAQSISLPALLADFVAQHLTRDASERLEFLCEIDASARLNRALEVATRELDLLTLGSRIGQQVRERVEKHQRQFFLREQLKAIRQELNEDKEPLSPAYVSLFQKLDAHKFPQDIQDKIEEEKQRLLDLPLESPEHYVVRSYLECVASLPWGCYSSTKCHIQDARKILNADHYGLEDVKERIIQYLAVQQLNKKRQGSLLCFSGPPGVGKTSLGRSIAQAVGRAFYRFSVGGLRDEAEIKGHRRTYIGAMPGRIVQALKSTQTLNPVIMLDELDKMGHDGRTDPTSSLLEVLDPVQNHHFVDYYLDLPLDLSQVMFIATVNTVAEIPHALRDRLEIIELPGYILEEKVTIARRYLWPRLKKEHGLQTRDLRIATPVLQKIVRDYTHESGVRELDRVLGKLCRQRALALVDDASTAVKLGEEVSLSNVTDWIGPPKFHEDIAYRHLGPGIALGLAWTPIGGEVLCVEALSMPGKGNVKITGQLGTVMQESADIALSFVRAHAERFGIDAKVFRQCDFHIHFPAGAIKKDGPSAGITTTAALLSLLSQTSLVSSVAMTGEMTLRGELLAVGGIREKVIAAKRAKLKTVILPARNQADVAEMPAMAKGTLKFVFAHHFDEVIATVFPALAEQSRSGKVKKLACEPTKSTTLKRRRIA
jgi:ATP-dependent Lon protease